MAAGGLTSVEAREALEVLAQQYWYPLYAFIRRRGTGPQEAEDLTQAFFAMMMEKHLLKGADASRGRFRSYLLGALKHFLSDQHDKARAEKRGGGRKLVSIDAAVGESMYCREPYTNETPERLYDRQWGMTVLNLALAELRAELEGNGKGRLFEAIQPCLTGDDSALKYHELGEQLGMSEGAVKTAVHRLRRQYRERVREQISRTLDGPGEIDDEVRHLFEALKASD